MKALAYFIIILVFISCQSDKQKLLDENLYNEIIKFQKNYPIPEKNPKKLIFVYKIYFWKDNKDTIIELQRSPAGISKDNKSFGVYQDNDLMPTFIYDKDSIGGKFILKKIINTSRDKYYWIKKGNTPESYPPIYSYKVKGRSLQLIKIDTVWKHWD